MHCNILLKQWVPYYNNYYYQYFPPEAGDRELAVYKVLPCSSRSLLSSPFFLSFLSFFPFFLSSRARVERRKTAEIEDLEISGLTFFFAGAPAWYIINYHNTNYYNTNYHNTNHPQLGLPNLAGQTRWAEAVWPARPGRRNGGISRCRHGTSQLGVYILESMISTRRVDSLLRRPCTGPAKTTPAQRVWPAGSTRLDSTHPTGFAAEDSPVFGDDESSCSN